MLCLNHSDENLHHFIVQYPEDLILDLNADVGDNKSSTGVHLRGLRALDIKHRLPHFQEDARVGHRRHHTRTTDHSPSSILGRLPKYCERSCLNPAPGVNTVCINRG